MTPEARHLLAALHEPEDRDDDLLDGLTDVEWANIASLAVRQRIAALLHMMPGLPMPDTCREPLHAHAERAATRVLRQQAAVLALANAVEPDGIRMVALKGLHLGCAVYPSPALREMGDVDVLVTGPDLPRVQTAAQDLGFRPLAAGVSEHHAPPLVRDGVVLELHLHIDSRSGAPRAQLDDLWSRLIQLPLAKNLWGLCPEDLLVHSALHGIDAHVMELGIRSLCDIRAILQKHGATLNPAHLQDQATRWQASRALQLGMALVERTFGFRAPDTIRPEPVEEDILSAAVEHIFDHTRPTSESAATFVDATWRRRLRLIKDRVLHPSGEAPLTRAIGLTRRHGRWLTQAALARRGATHQALDRRRALRHWLRR
jgi:hypothetical protein